MKKKVHDKDLVTFCTPPERVQNILVEPRTGKGYFGISCVSSFLPVATLLEIGDQEGFSAIELSETQLDALNISQRNKIKEYFPIVNGGAFISPSLGGNILHCDKKMLDDFIGNLEKVFEKFSSQNVKKLTLDLPMEEILVRGDEEEEEKLLLLLKKLYPVLSLLGVHILLPCRIRRSFSIELRDKISCFLRRCMSPFIKLHLQIYPHELNKDTDLFELCSFLGFDTECVTLIYNADKGETIVRAHLDPILEYLCYYSFRGGVLLSPLSRDGAFSMNEAGKYAMFLKEIRKNPSAKS